MKVAVIVDGAVRVQELVRNVSENGGAARGDAAFGDEDKKFGEKCVDFRGELEFGEFPEEFGGEIVGVGLESRWADRRMRRLGKRHLDNLTNDEKQHCKWFVDTNGDSLHHNEANGALGSLIEKHILYTPGQPWGNGMRDFRIRPWALEYLKDHPKLVE